MNRTEVPTRIPAPARLLAGPRRMTPARFLPSARFSAPARVLTHTVLWLSFVAALSGLVLTTTATAQAQTVSRPAVARAAAASVSAPQPIAINTANWSGSAGFGSRSPAWYTDSSGLVHLQGAATQFNSGGNDPDQVGTLPPAARPAHQLFTIVHTFNGTYTTVVIEPTGEIFVNHPPAPIVRDFSFVSLEGISYAPSRKGNPIPLNTANWTSIICCGSVAWYKDRSGVVHLQGAVGQIAVTGGSPNLIGTLPVAARPAQTVYTIVACTGGTYADLAIEPNGTLNLIDPRPPAAKNYSLVSLESISYQPSGTVHSIPLNISNWSGSAGFGSRPPAWYTDKSGIVHLQGAITQFSAAGVTPNVIGSLPSSVAPKRTVYTIVHTFNGTYADLAIQPTGTIEVINPRPPMVTDYTFVSLESITYRR